MYALLLVMLGGALGSGARHLVNRAGLALLGPGYPYGTLTVNLVGGFLMGLLVGLLARLAVPGDGWRLFLGVGVLGGFTTFSTFSLDAISLYERGETAAAAIYVFASVVAALAGLFAGLALVRAVLGGGA